MSHLKKEFSTKAVQRMRNLVSGNYGEASGHVIGNIIEDKDRKEGDVWIENDKTWEIKNGVRRNITKLDKIKEIYKIPMFCPECKSPMNKRNDKSFYPIHKKCFNCVVKMESQIKRDGKWEEYERDIHNSEIDNQIRLFNLHLDEGLSESNKGFISEDGKMEHWSGSVNKEKVEEYRVRGVEYLNSLKI